MNVHISVWCWEIPVDAYVTLLHNILCLHIRKQVSRDSRPSEFYQNFNQLSILFIPQFLVTRPEALTTFSWLAVSMSSDSSLASDWLVMMRRDFLLQPGDYYSGGQEGNSGVGITISNIMYQFYAGVLQNSNTWCRYCTTKRIAKLRNEQSAKYPVHCNRWDLYTALHSGEILGACRKFKE